MKYKACLVLLLSIALFACKKEVVASNYDKSFLAWLAFKKSAANSYTYVAYGGSVFGYYTEWKTTVQNGKITNRNFVTGRYKPNTDSLLVTASWAESGSTLNTHGESAYFLTMDQVYEQAKNVWLNVDAKKNDVHFTTDTEGLIASAGSTEKGCQDDCFNGIKVKDVKAFVKEIK